MTQFPRSLTTCVFLASLAGCVIDEAEPSADSLRKGELIEVDDTLWCEVELEPPSAAQACDERRRLAFMPPGSSCEGPVGVTGHWNGGSLFQTSHPYLDRFCTFTWQENLVNAPPELGLLDVLAERHDAQCDSVSSDGSPWGDAVAGELSTVFRAHVDHLAHPDNQTGMLPHAVDVTLVDTKAEGLLNSHSQHGETLGELVEDIICNGLHGCARTTKYSVAMPRYFDANHQSTGPDPAGGSFGAYADLANGLDEAYQQMLSSNAERTVINFSGGWEPSVSNPGITEANQLAILAGGPQYGIATGPRAIHASLVALRCAGALPIVAAGNRVPGACEYGPKLPAAWETLPALTRSECASLGFKVGKDPQRPNHSSTSTYRPLVYSVGGLNYEGHRLGNARPEGMPRLAAPGQNGVARVANQYSLAYSGSSVSSAVVAATAGLAWSYFPSLSASDLMDAIYDSGHDLTDVVTGQTMLSDYSRSANPHHVRQIGVCSALDHLCGLNNVGCNLSCSPGHPDTSALLQLSTALRDGALQPPPTPFLIPDWDKVPCADACTGTPTSVEFSVVATPPLTGVYPLPTYIPDPSDPSCASCELDYPDPLPTGATLLLSLDSAYSSPSITLEHVWLVSYFADGSSTTNYLGTGTELPLQTTTMTLSVTPHTSLIPVSAIVRMQFWKGGQSYTRETAIPVIVGY